MSKIFDSNKVKQELEYNKNWIKNMRRPCLPPRNYKNELLMSELNEMMIRIKAHLFLVNDPDYKDKINLWPKPTISELDMLNNKLMQALKRDSESFVKY
jgi:hypothetical protein